MSKPIIGSIIGRYEHRSLLIDAIKEDGDPATLRVVQSMPQKDCSYWLVGATNAADAVTLVRRAHPECANRVLSIGRGVDVI